jgi:hypothetical protein
LPGSYQILTELIQEAGKTFRSAVLKLIAFVVRSKEKVPQQWKEHSTVPIYRKDNKS